MKDKKIVFVCTGNTCRSPMAESIFNALAAAPNVTAYSCGISVAAPFPASSGACKAALNYGADLSGHLSKPASAALFRGASGIYCMTKRQADIVKAAYPEFASLVRTLCDSDVSDPFGGDPEDYRRAADQIYEGLISLISELKES